MKRMRVAHQGDLRRRRYWLQMPFVPSPPMDRTPQPPRTPTQAFHRLLAAINLHTQRSHRRSPAESTLRVHIASQLRAVSPSHAHPCSPPVVGTYGRRVEAQKVAETAALCLSSFSLTLSRIHELLSAICLVISLPADGVPAARIMRVAGACVHQVVG